MLSGPQLTISEARTSALEAVKVSSTEFFNRYAISQRNSSEEFMKKKHII